MRLRLALVVIALAPLALAGCHHAAAPYNPAYSAPAISANPPNDTTLPPRPSPPPATPVNPAPGLAALGPPVLVEEGLASWYGPNYHRHAAADGSIYDQNGLTVAHRELPLGTIVRVTNLTTQQSVIARVTDRGPFVQGRTLDLSLAAARAIGVYGPGTARVRIEAFRNPTADPAGRWAVQIGVFIDPADATQLKNDLAQRIPNARVITFAGPTGHWVRIDPRAPTRANAEQIAASIHLPDADPYVVRLN